MATVTLTRCAQLVLEALVPAEVLTCRFQLPGFAGPPVTAMISFGEITSTLPASIAGAALPCDTRTTAPAPKPLPVIVTVVPPVAGPEAGLTEVTTGRACTANGSSTEAGW